MEVKEGYDVARRRDVIWDTLVCLHPYDVGTCNKDLLLRIEVCSLFPIITSPVKDGYLGTRGVLTSAVSNHLEHRWPSVIRVNYICEFFFYLTIILL